MCRTYFYYLYICYSLYNHGRTQCMKLAAALPAFILKKSIIYLFKLPICPLIVNLLDNNLGLKPIVSKVEDSLFSTTLLINNFI